MESPSRPLKGFRQGNPDAHGDGSLGQHLVKEEEIKRKGEGKGGGGGVVGTEENRNKEKNKKGKKFEKRTKKRRKKMQADKQKAAVRWGEGR